MNTPFDKTSAADVERMLGISRGTVQAWCRKGIINCTNVSEGDKYGRWLIDDDEVNYIMDLKKKFGTTREAMLHYRKNWKEGKKPAEVKRDMKDPMPWSLDMDVVKDPYKDCKTYETKPLTEKQEKLAVSYASRYDKEPIKVVPTVSQTKEVTIDPNKVATTIMYMQDIKARIQDCKAELASLEEEYKVCKQEVEAWL